MECFGILSGKNRIVFLVAFLLLFASCDNNFLNVAPEAQLSDATFWETEEHVDLALTGLYHNWESHWDILWWDLMSDNGYAQHGDVGIRDIGNGQVNVSTSFEGVFAPGRDIFHIVKLENTTTF